ncbi:selenocysteine-specific translation elongation factor [Actinomadura sp. HBU206391]|uniref:selenocysteine-specific translation elongation factor n=1 Tax=Actinomadura sp. HBU206391 TaxID=2731692 RepID=UPI00164F8F87|nr:selenocysteine-specific translation elongation factor [Actinomadura sp. HBU206391]MBC6462534.1 selenocysteine-specific translation elongation factor [Actinomadura sp. HBU206391]
MRVIATAGHVDHGKSTLVRALTGMEPDRWAEERRRGMTIDLGFAWTELPSGARLAFVDVPGHEKFITNMLAGIGPAPAVMIVVAADEGWMPQSAEHLAAVDALGVRDGLLVITRADLAAPDDALRQARREMAGSTLADHETVVVSGRTGEGLEELRAALDRLAARSPEPDTDAPVRLWIDRAFTIKGSGTVVTGTLTGGAIAVGDELVLAPGGERVRVRGLESLKKRADRIDAVARVAVNLRGVDLSGVSRGMAVTSPGGWTATDEIDVRTTGDERLTARELTLHIGSAAVTARVRPFGDDTARLRLSTQLPLHVGDRAVLRDPGTRRVMGASVLDVAPPPLRRRGAAARRASELSGRPDRPGGEIMLRQHQVMREAEIVAMGCEPTGLEVAPGWRADPAYWEKARRRLQEVVSRHAADHPLDPGVPVETVRQLLELPDRRLATALVHEPLRLRDGRVHGAAGPAELPETIMAAVRQVHGELETAPFQAPEADRLAALGLTGKSLAAAERAGLLLRIAPGIVLAPGADADAARILATLPQPFTASEARTALGTSRRVVIPLLEHLDRRGRTERLADNRRRCR